MKKGHFTIIAILFIAVASLFAQNALPPVHVEFPATVIAAKTTTVPDTLSFLSEHIDQLQAEIGTYKIHSQSDRVTFYGLQRQLAQARHEYYSLLASVSPGQASKCRQTAWKFKQDADQFAQKQYASIPSESLVPTPLGRLPFNQ